MKTEVVFEQCFFVLDQECHNDAWMRYGAKSRREMQKGIEEIAKHTLMIEKDDDEPNVHSWLGALVHASRWE